MLHLAHRLQTAAHINRSYSLFINVIFVFLVIFIGPPTTLEIAYFGANDSVCFDSYSHPEYPVQYRSVSIAINDHKTDTVHRFTINQTLESGTACFPFPIPVCNNTDSCCKTLSASGIASNALGNSEAGATNVVITGQQYVDVVSFGLRTYFIRQCFLSESAGE